MPATFNRRTQSWDNLSQTGGGSGFTASSELRGKPTKFDKQVRKNKKAQSVKIAGRPDFVNKGSIGPSVQNAAKLPQNNQGPQDFGQGSFSGGAGGSFGDSTSQVNAGDSNITSQFTGGAGVYQAASPEEQFFMTSLGETISGFKAGATLSTQVAGRDFETMSPIYEIGYLAGLGSTAATANIFSKWTLGGAATTTGTGIVANTKTASMINSASGKVAIGTTWKVIGALGVGTLVAKEILTLTLGGKVFGSFVGMEEANQAASLPAWEAYRAGDWEAYDIAASARDEVIQNKTFWGGISDLIPFKNSIDGLNKYREAAQTGGKVMDKLAENKRIKEENGESDRDYWDRVREEEIAADKASVDYYNEQKKLMVEWEREAARNARNEDAAFWRKEQERTRELEAKERKAIADFWTAYRKLEQKAQEERRPSNLNFGLF